MPVITLPTVGEAAWGTKMNTAVNAVNTQVDTNTTDITTKLDTASAAELIRDTMGTALVAGTNVTITVNDAGDTITIAATAGSGAAWGTITGTLASQTDLQTALSAKITAFADPNADRIVFWDDSASAFAALSVNAPLSITTTSMSVATSSETVVGAVELATAAETITGTDNTRAVHPAGVTATRGLYVGVNAQIGTTYAPVLTDQGKLVTCTNAAAITVTLPSNATTAFPIGTQIDFAGMGAGKITFVAGASATAVGTPSLVTRAQYSAASAIKTATDAWLIVGDLA